MTRLLLITPRRARAFATFRLLRSPHFRPSSRWTRRRNDEGSILIITFLFLIMVSLIVVTLSSWTSNGLNNTVRFKKAANELYSADGVTQIAIRSARYTYPTSLSEVCPGTPNPIEIDGVSVQVWCSTVDNVGVYITRQTTLTACLTNSQLTGACTTSAGNVPQLLVATVDFDDATVNSNPYNPNCSSSNQSTCGAAMTIVSWESR